MTFWTNKRKFRCTEAIIDPTVNDDASTGYGKLDIWLNTVSCEIFMLADETTGAAKWVQIDASATTTSECIEFGAKALDGSSDILWSAVTFDNSGNGWAAAATITVPAGAAGDYKLLITITDRDTVEYQACYDISVNGTPVLLIDNQNTVGTLSAPYKSTMTGNKMVTLAVGDTITVTCIPFAGAPILNAPAAPTLFSTVLSLQKC
jgi:hypothetical protein